MTREDRVKRYMKILGESERGNSTRNWKILDKLTDEELFNENKIAESLNVIDKCDMRLQNNPNKYPETIMRYVRQSLDIDEYDDAQDVEINKMSTDEVFEHVCNWNGFIGSADCIKSWIEDIYGISLTT